jgi:regulator of protease activity HflC (stomatin/prohibitin superfamily)
MVVLGIAGLLGLGVIGFAASARVVHQFEKGVVFRLGRVQTPPRSAGLTMIIPVVDRLRKVNAQIVTLPVPAQDGITRDNVTVRVDAVAYFRVRDPVRATVEVQDYQFAVLQVAQTSLRSIIGKSDLDDLLCNRESLNQGLALMIDSPATGWGIEIDRVEIKDVALPESMKRSMSRQAEAERERRHTSSPRTESFRPRRSRGRRERHGGYASGTAAAVAPDDRRGGRREELDLGPTVPR